MSVVETVVQLDTNKLTEAIVPVILISPAIVDCVMHDLPVTRINHADKIEDENNSETINLEQSQIDSIDKVQCMDIENDNSEIKNNDKDNVSLEAHAELVEINEGDKMNPNGTIQFNEKNEGDEIEDKENTNLEAPAESTEKIDGDFVHGQLKESETFVNEITTQSVINSIESSETEDIIVSAHENKIDAEVIDDLLVGNEESVESTEVVDADHKLEINHEIEVEEGI